VVPLVIVDQNLPLFKREEQILYPHIAGTAPAGKYTNAAQVFEKLNPSALTHSTIYNSHGKLQRRIT